MKQRALALLLSQLVPLQKHSPFLEQYQTDGTTAAQVLWNIFLQGHIGGKNIADLGCGNGILGIGALVLGAQKVIFVDADIQAILIAKKNKHLAEKTLALSFAGSFLCQDVMIFKKQVDVVIQNPPFGVQQPHADKLFLTTAFRCAPLIYSFHKLESKKFIKAFAQDNGFVVKRVLPLAFPLQRTQAYHKKKRYYVRVGLWEIVRI